MSQSLSMSAQRPAQSLSMLFQRPLLAGSFFQSLAEDDDMTTTSSRASSILIRDQDLLQITNSMIQFGIVRSFCCPGIVLGIATCGCSCLSKTTEATEVDREESKKGTGGEESREERIDLLHRKMRVEGDGGRE